jgi:hypothetical protein
LPTSRNGLATFFELSFDRGVTMLTTALDAARVSNIHVLCIREQLIYRHNADAAILVADCQFLFHG